MTNQHKPTYIIRTRPFSRLGLRRCGWASAVWKSILGLVKRGFLLTLMMDDTCLEGLTFPTHNPTICRDSGYSWYICLFLFLIFILPPIIWLYRWTYMKYDGTYCFNSKWHNHSHKIIRDTTSHLIFAVYTWWIPESSSFNGISIKWW